LAACAGCIGNEITHKENATQVVIAARIKNPAALFCGFWLVDGGFAEELFAVV
jgi:hypothetical protein